jgi:non-ribosomal peptide synthetase component F
VSTNLAAQLVAAARRRPDHPALVWDGGALTWRELEARAAAVAARRAEFFCPATNTVRHRQRSRFSTETT